MSAELDTTGDSYIVREHAFSQVQVRRATLADIHVIADFAHALEQDLLQHDTSRRRVGREELLELHAGRLRDKEPDWRYIYHIAEREGVAVGFVFGKAPHPQKPYDYAHLQGIHVTESARKTGAAEALVTHFVDTAQERGLRHATADVYIGTRGHGFFSRLGWHATPDPINQQVLRMTMPVR